MTKYSQFAGLLSLALFGIALPSAIYRKTFAGGSGNAATGSNDTVRMSKFGGESL